MLVSGGHHGQGVFWLENPADPKTDTWSSFETPYTSQWRNLGLAVIDTKIYAVGGWDGTSAFNAARLRTAADQNLEKPTSDAGHYQ